MIYKRTYADKVDLFKRLLDEQQTVLGKESPIFKELISNLLQAGKLRNMVVHANWESAHDDGYTLCRFKMKKGEIQHEYVQFSPESLDNELPRREQRGIYKENVHFQSPQAAGN